MKFKMFVDHQDGAPHFVQEADSIEQADALIKEWGFNQPGAADMIVIDEDGHWYDAGGGKAAGPSGLAMNLEDEDAEATAYWAQYFKEAR